MSEPKISAELIESELDKQEQDEEQNFDAWFKGYIETSTKSKSKSDDGEETTSELVSTDQVDKNDGADEQDEMSHEIEATNVDDVDQSTIHEVGTDEPPTSSDVNEPPTSSDVNESEEIATVNEPPTSSTVNEQPPTTDEPTNNESEEIATVNEPPTSSTVNEPPTSSTVNEQPPTTDEPTNNESEEIATVDEQDKTTNNIKQTSNDYTKQKELNESQPEPTQLTISQVTKQESQPEEPSAPMKKHHKHRSRKLEVGKSTKAPTVVKETESGKIEIGTKKAKQLSDEELEAKIMEAKQKLTDSIDEQVKEMEMNGNCRKLDLADYTPGSNTYSWYRNFLLNPIFVPSRFTTRFPLAEFVNGVTKFHYNPFDAPNEAMTHPIPEKVIYTTRLNKLFGYEFVNPQKGDYHFADLDKRVLEYLSQFREQGTLLIEYMLVQRFMGKLMINLNTDVELALRDNTRPTLNSQFKQAIVADIQMMKLLQSQSGKLYTSWKTFQDTLLGLGPDNLIYVPPNENPYKALNDKLKTSYKTDFLTETLCANALRCYLPSIVINYFFAIKSVYIITRLLSVYMSKELNKNKSTEEIVNDLYTIAVAGVIMYENKSYIYKQAPRSLPKYDKPISQETQMYILNHLLTGGQFYMLKMFEECLPSLANEITKRE